ncbi:uncharacterized LabA/DUF88 family protein [Bradyrhizobium sp. F1.13.1]|jgi:uncharacterized LabA/DUF88 family protein
MAVKGNMDIELAVDAMELAEHLDHADAISSEYWDIAAFVKTDCR